MDSSTINIEFNNEDETKFTLSGVNVSLANAIRRTILSDINTVVFNTTNHENSSKNCIIHENTSRLNNEIIKQRLSCVPIKVEDLTEFDIDNHYMEVNVENTTPDTIYVTTEDFNIYQRVGVDDKDKAPIRISKDKRDEIFPRNMITQDYIDFVRLRPKVGVIPAEKLHLVCSFSIANAKQDGMFNVVSTCSYGFSVDKVEQEKILQLKRTEWADERKDVDFEEANWKLLDGLRVTKKDSFDFTIESVGVFSTYDLVIKSCNIINRKLDEFITSIPELKIEELSRQNTISNSYDFILNDDDYTIGKVIEYMMYTMYYEADPILSFCGYKKMHPHDPHSTLRLAFKDNMPLNVIQSLLENAAKTAIIAFCRIKDIMKTKTGGRKHKK